MIFCSCQKSPINGDLDGRWQIMEIEVGNEVRNVRENQLYYNFYLHVCNLSYYGGWYTVGNFSHENNLLFINFPYIQTNQGNLKLQEYGIYSNPVTFHIEHLTKEKLIIKEGDVVITLRKF